MRLLVGIRVRRSRVLTKAASCPITRTSPVNFSALSPTPTPWGLLMTSLDRLRSLRELLLPQGMRSTNSTLRNPIPSWRPIFFRQVRRQLVLRQTLKKLLLPYRRKRPIHYVWNKGLIRSFPWTWRDQRTIVEYIPRWVNHSGCVRVLLECWAQILAGKQWIAFELWKTEMQLVSEQLVVGCVVALILSFDDFISVFWVGVEVLILCWVHWYEVLASCWSRVVVFLRLDTHWLTKAVIQNRIHRDVGLLQVHKESFRDIDILFVFNYLFKLTSILNEPTKF